MITLDNLPNLGEPWAEQGGVLAAIFSDRVLVIYNGEHQISSGEFGQLDAPDTLGGFADWVVPTIQELQVMQLNLPTVFTAGDWFWSSDEIDAGIAWAQTGDDSCAIAKNCRCKFVLVRRFALVEA